MNRSGFDKATRGEIMWLEGRSFDEIEQIYASPPKPKVEYPPRYVIENLSKQKIGCFI